MRRIFELDGFKPSTAEFAVSLDLTSWLGTGVTIYSVAFTAKCLNDNSVATTTVLDSTKNANTTTTVSPWIKGGTSGNTYLVKIQVVSTSGFVEIFGLQFTVYDY